MPVSHRVFCVCGAVFILKRLQNTSKHMLRHRACRMQLDIDAKELAANSITKMARMDVPKDAMHSFLY
jgi:hypothetical protein